MGEDREGRGLAGLRLRRATHADAAAIAGLVRLAFAAQSAPTNPPSSALRETPATITRELDLGSGAVVESGGALAGTVLWHEEAGSLYVAGCRCTPRIAGGASHDC